MALWHLPWILISQRKRTCFDLIRFLSFSFCVPCSVLQFQAVSSVGWTWNHWSPREICESFADETRCRCQSRSCLSCLCRSCTGRMPKRSERVAATWSDSNKSTVQSLEGDGKTRNLPWRHSRVTCLIALFFWKDQLRNPPKTLDSVDSFDRKLALSYCQGFCFWGSMWHVVGRLNFSKFC